MKGNAVGLITAILSFAVVAWQGYKEYVATHPPAAVTMQVPSDTPVYWNDGTNWYCRVGDQQYVWVPNQQQPERLAWQQPTQRLK